MYIYIYIGPLLYHWVSDVEDNNDPRYRQSIEVSYIHKYIKLHIDTCISIYE
jgi:hypothetical protein